MFLPRRLLPLTVALGAMLLRVQAATPTLEGWYKCSEVSFAEQIPEDATTAIYERAECATFKAPLCYEGVCEDATNKEIDIFVKRISGPLSAGAPNIFFMQGGPGAASPAMEDAMSSISSMLNRRVNVYTMDHRGTGRSTKLDCVAAQAQTSGSPGGASVVAAEVGSCADELQSKYGKDLAAFSVTSAASDLKLFITSFLPKEKTYVYGVSYGSSLVERLIHLEPEGVAGYILDGISTTSGSDVKNFEYFSTWDVDYDEVAEYFMASCSKRPSDCGQYFTDATLSKSLRSLMAELDGKKAKCYEPLDIILGNLFGYGVGEVSPGISLRQIMGSLLASAFRRRFIPVITHRLSRCSEDDIKVVNHLMTQLYGGSSGGVTEDDLFTSDLVYKIIVYSEFWETPTPSTEQMFNRFLNTSVSSGSYTEVETYCVFSKEDSPACKEFADNAQYEAGKILYKRDKYWNVAAKPPTDVSVLVMSSKMDPQTPHKYAEFLFEALDTDNKKLVTFDAATHATLWTTPYTESGPTCGMEIVASYLAADGDLETTDFDCVDLMPDASFLLPADYVAEYLNATSAYDGRYTGKDGLPTPAPVASKSSNNNNNSSSPSEGNNGSLVSATESTSYLAVFIAFAALFVLAAAAAAVFVVKYRRAKKQQSLETAAPYTASTV